MANWYQYEKKENLLSIIDGQSMFRDKNNSIFSEARIRLKELALILEDQEESLYTSLGVKDLEDLQRRMDEVNKDTGFRSFNNLQDSDFDKIVLSVAEGMDLSRPVVFTFEKDSTAKQLLQDLAKEEAQGVMLEFLQELRKISKGEIKNIHLTGSQGVGKRLGEYKIGIDSKNIQLKVTLNEAIKRKQLEELAEKLQANLEQEEDNIKIRLQRVMLDKITNPNIRRLVEEEFRVRGDWYDVNSSKASIKGYLGEIHANVTAKYLFGSADVFATGNIRDLKGQEIPIDMVINNIGFQIKNYRIDKGETLFRYKGDAGKFIENRVRPEQSLSDLLVTFFGAYQYHGQNESYTKMARERLANGGSIPTIFNAYIDNIMRISDSFGAKDNEQGLFLGEQTYYNTFFLISDKLVPSSAMVWAIYNELGQSMSSVYRTNWVFSNPEKETARQPASSPNILADKIKVELFLYLNVANVLNHARSLAEKAEGVDIK